MDDLGDCLRAWRDRLDPAELGLPRTSRRRAPGLRREELADLAGLSVDYLSRLEQGRATRPSPSVLEPLARALRLTEDEREHLFRLAGLGPTPRGLRRHLTPGVQRVLDRLGDVAVMVLDAGWDVVELNPLAAALLGEQLVPGTSRPNVVWLHFTDADSRVEYGPGERERFGLALVADLHSTLGRHPDDPAVRRLVADLLPVSPRFAALWRERTVHELAASRKTIRHPEVGPIELDCDTFTVQGTDLRLVIYTAAPGSEAASRLALLAAVGAQHFAFAGSQAPPRVSTDDVTSAGTP